VTALAHANIVQRGKRVLRPHRAWHILASGCWLSSCDAGGRTGRLKVAFCLFTRAAAIRVGQPGTLDYQTMRLEWSYRQSVFRLAVQLPTVHLINAMELTSDFVEKGNSRRSIVFKTTTKAKIHNIEHKNLPTGETNWIKIRNSPSAGFRGINCTRRTGPYLLHSSLNSSSNWSSTSAGVASYCNRTTFDSPTPEDDATAGEGGRMPPLRARLCITI